MLNVNLKHIISELLHNYHVAPEQLLLEITESSVMVEPEIVLDSMKKLSEMGIDFGIDDFGTGYSSMEYLRNLPVQELKIDKC